MNAKKKSLHVNQVGENWEVESEVGFLGQTETKSEAEELATTLAEEMGTEEVEVHTADGKVEKTIKIVAPVESDDHSPPEGQKGFMNHDSPDRVPPGATDFDTFFPDDENGAILRKLRLSGLDLDRLQAIDFFFEFPSELAAAAFHREENEPLAIDCCFEMEGKWIVRVTKFLIPTHQTINELQERLIHIAALHQGKADGWSCSPQG